MTKARVARNLCFLVGALTGLIGLLLVLGAGGENDERATTIELVGHSVSTAAAGALFVVAAAALVAVGFAVGRRAR